MIDFDKLPTGQLYDQADACTLIVAMHAVRDAYPDYELPLLPSDVFKCALNAAKALTKLAKDEGDDWDGVVWFERLSDCDDMSPAFYLYNEVVKQCIKTPEDVIRWWLADQDLLV